MIAMILVRNLHRDIMRYNRVPTDEEKAEERDDTGWKVPYMFTHCISYGSLRRTMWFVLVEVKTAALALLFSRWVQICCTV